MSGCIKQVLPGGDEGGGAPPPLKLSPLDEGRSAFVKGDYGTAEAIALRLVADKSLSKPDSAEAGRLLTASALQNNHPRVAVTGLEHWRTAASGADGRKEWQDAWCKALRGLASHDARTRANEVYQDAARSAAVRSTTDTVFLDRERRMLIGGDHLIKHISSNPLISRSTASGVVVIVSTGGSAGRGRSRTASMVLDPHRPQPP